MKSQRLNLNLLLTHKWLVTQHARDQGPDFAGGVRWAVLCILITVCMMVW